MEQKNKLNPWKQMLILCYCYFVFMAITASAVQFVTEGTVLLKVYNWLICITVIIALLTKFIIDSFNNYPFWITWPLQFMVIVLGIIGIIICYQYEEFIPEILATFGSR